MSGARDLVADFAPGASPKDVVGEHYLLLDGATGNYASTPDHVSLDITGDIDIRVDARLDNWFRPGSLGSVFSINEPLVGKWVTAGDQRSWFLSVSLATVFFGWTTGGTTATAGAGAVQAVPFLSPMRRAILRVTLDADNGAGGHVVSFYYADPFTGGTIDAGPWTLIETFTNSGTTSIFSSSAPLQVGEVTDTDSAAATLDGKVYQVQVRSSIGGTVVANPVFSANGTTSFADSAGRTWTLAGDAEIAGFDWIDVSDRLLHADWDLGRANELDPYPPAGATLRLKNDDRLLDPDHASGTYAGHLLPRTPWRLQSIASALDLPSAGSATTPDHPSFAVTDLDVRIRLALADWSPGGFGGFLVSQFPLASGNNGWVLAMTASGQPELTFTTNGSTDITRTCSAATGFADGSDHWLRVTLDADDGSGNHVVRFYTSDDGVTWTQLGATITTAGTVSLFNSTGSLAVGLDALPPNATVRYAELRSGIDGQVVAAPSFMDQAPGTTSFRDGCGRTWTLSGSASIALDTTLRSDEFYGFVDGPWEQHRQPPGLCDCVITLIDRLGVMGGYELPDVYDQAVLEREPVGFWVLGNSSTAADEIPDLGSGHNDGTVVGNVQFGQRPVQPGHDQSALVEAASPIAPPDKPLSFIDITNSSQIVTGDLSEASIVATFRARTAARTGGARCLFIQSNGNENPNRTAIQLSVDDDGLISYAWVNVGGGFRYEWPTTVVDNQGHIVFGQGFGGFGIAVDQSALTNATASGVGFVTNGVGIGGHSGIFEADQWDGWIGAVALWNRPLASGERELILDGYSKLDGLRSDQHVDWALDQIGVPPDFRNLDQGSVLMGPAQTAGEDGLEWIGQVVATEQGEWYVDHRDAGRLRFRDRYARFTQTRSTTVQIVFSDDPANTEPVVRVERDDFELASNAADKVINQANVEWRDGREAIEDRASRDRYGPKPRSVTTQATAAAQARSVGEWLVARYKDPRSLVRGLGIHPAAARAGFRAVDHLRIGDRVRCRYHPQQVGSATTVDLFVEGIHHTAQGLDWDAHYDLSPVDTFQVGLWGISVWGTARWG